MCTRQVTQPAGEVVKPGAWKSVADEGMPVHGRPYEKGNLYIHFNVKFPDALEAWQVDALRTTLPAPEHAAALNGAMDTDTEPVGTLHPLVVFSCINTC